MNVGQYLTPHLCALAVSAVLSACADSSGGTGSDGGASQPASDPIENADSIAPGGGDSIVFDSLHWDFGKVDDDASAVRHTYAFINPSPRPFRIGAVDASCSCISIDYPREPVPAGGRGEITLSFMPAGASGPVHRSAEVYDEAGAHIATLSMLADVNRVDADIEDLYHHTISEQLLVDRADISFGYLHHGETLSKIVRIANVSRQALSLRLSVADASSMLSVEGPSSIGPRSEEEILLTYRIPDDGNLFGTASDEVLISADGEPMPESLRVSAVFMAALPEAEKKPFFWTSPSLIELNQARFGKNFKGSLELGNLGEGDLHILAVVSPVPIPIEKGTVLSPGQTMRLKVSSPVESFTAQVFTDDPSRPYKELIFK